MQNTDCVTDAVTGTRHSTGEYYERITAQYAHSGTVEIMKCDDYCNKLLQATSDRTLYYITTNTQMIFIINK